MEEQFVYRFFKGSGQLCSSESNNILGAKGAMLSDMCYRGVNVPPGFTISSKVCKFYYQNNKTLSHEIVSQINYAMKELENQLNLKFGDNNIPLLVSVRSGSSISMPGMLDSILNVGINDNNVTGLANRLNNERVAYDSYRRLIQMYGNVVLHIETHHFEEILDKYRVKSGLQHDSELSIVQLKSIINDYKEIIHKISKSEFPQSTKDQFWNSIYAVFNSWINPRALQYREINNIPEDIGTAVNIQSMVFGNSGENSATGVVFTRNPINGSNELFGEYLINAQGEDVVSGAKLTYPLTIKLGGALSLETKMPDIFQGLFKISKNLESYYSDMQDIEFTVESGNLWILQTRNGKRSAEAAINIALDMYGNGSISPEDAINMVDPSKLEKLMHPTISEQNNKHKRVLTKGLAASPGAAYGMIALSANVAQEKSKEGQVILVRHETSPDDIGGMNIAAGILTARGGLTSHAAVVARGMGRPCVCGASEMIIDLKNKKVSFGDIILNEGDCITINGSSGEVILGNVEMSQPKLSNTFFELIKLSDPYRTIEVRANAEVEDDVKTAIKLGAWGIGLCRTEHMFFSSNRILDVRKMILADSKEEMTEAIEILSKYQQNDFELIFSLSNDLPVTIRLLDPPLHEFLPHLEHEINEFCRYTNKSFDVVNNKINRLKEHNPMLGHRGCRLAVTHPEIYKMQIYAIFKAVIKLMHQNPLVKYRPEIMVPFIMCLEEVIMIKSMVHDIANELSQCNNCELKFQFGAMIELPRAALNTDEIAQNVDFCSFGTNDLTQAVMGISRDDSESFLVAYKDRNFIAEDPFISIDINGVGKLIEFAVKMAREANPNIKLGVCGEHAGDVNSIKFFHDLKLDYVSVSPYRIPIAKLALARCNLKKQTKQ